MKMVDLHFVDFVLIPSPVKKETQFKLPDDFSEFDFTDSLTDIEVTSWLVSADDFSSRVARGANERVSAANE